MVTIRLFRFASSGFGRKFGAGVRQMETLVSSSWLAEQLSKKPDSVRLVHASWTNCADYAKAHIPGAVCFDGESCRDKSSLYKNMLPKPEEFARYVGETLGIDNNTDVVIYDSTEASPLIPFASRVWYMFRVFGHDRVALLNGGLKRWTEEKRPLTDQATEVTPKNFTSNFRRDLVLSYEEVLDKVAKNAQIQLVDARSPDSFKGIGKDPFGKSGHITNATNLFVQLLVDPQTKLIREKEQLKQLFIEAGVDLDRPMATSCGTGMTATGPALAAFLLGKKQVPVYDGSWFEWARRAPDEYITKD